MSLKIDFFLLGLNNPTINAWFQGMYSSFFEGLGKTNCQVTYSKSVPNLQANLLVVPLGRRQDQSSAQAMRAFGGPVALYVPSASEWFRPGYLRRWKQQILFAYGTDFSRTCVERYNEVGIDYYCVPFASNPVVMKPLEMPRCYDVVFAGSADSGHGRELYVNTLLHYARDRKVLFMGGSGWEKFGFPSQSVAWGDMLNIIYSVSRIGINIHCSEQKLGHLYRLDANNRLFDLAMAGCFQISNAPEVVREYFDPSEVIAIDDPQEWAAATMYYLDHPEETEPYRIAARKRALADHTWEQRARQFVQIAETYLSAWRPGNVTVDMSIQRFRDLYLPPYSPADVANKITRRLRTPRNPGK